MLEVNAKIPRLKAVDARFATKIPGMLPALALSSSSLLCMRNRISFSLIYCEIGVSAYGQKEGEVGVVLILMNEGGEVGCLGHRGGGDRVQVGNNRFGIGIDIGASGQGGESAIGVELEEGGLEVLAVDEADGLNFDIDGELLTERYIRICQA
jgi:hypothetical protein